jgi:hypothetical protein
MTLFPEAMRAAVEQRADHRCEYCHVPTRGQVATFPIDHVIPRNSGGVTALENLALTCPHCNAHKWKYGEGVDLLSGASTPLFNLRTDVWSDHFQWSAKEVGVLEGRTPCGRATIARLQMNDPRMRTVRQLLAELGLFPEAAGQAQP